MRIIDKIIFHLMIFLSLVLFVVVGISLFYPFKPLEIYEPVRVLTKEVMPGDTIFVEFNFKKNTDIIPDITLSLVDGVVYNLPSYRPINKPGEVQGRVVGVMEVPASIPCGEYYLQWLASYRYNTLRTVNVEYRSEKFRINNTICAE